MYQEQEEDLLKRIRKSTELAVKARRTAHQSRKSLKQSDLDLLRSYELIEQCREIIRNS